MSEIWFYRLEGRSVADVLPTLLEKSMERGWRTVVE
ncbi:MAG: DNA polymerase III subunit chi, partial [Aestuariivirgaceae bacterium]|nr:DNA polymerase III subunit chi [Aestuariivirgaceae bacterium]